MDNNHCSDLSNSTNDLHIICDEQYYRCWQDGSALRISLKKDWILTTVGILEKEIANLKIDDRNLDEVSFLCGGLRDLDLSGAMLLYRTAEMLKAKGIVTDFTGFRAEHFKFIEQVLAIEKTHEKIVPPPPLLIRCFKYINGFIDTLAASLSQRICFLKDLACAFLNSFKHPSRVRIIAMVRHIEDAGVKALPVVLTMAFQK